MTRAFDSAVLALLDASPRIVLWKDATSRPGPGVVILFDGKVADADEQAETIGAPLPYLVFHRTPGRPTRQVVGRASTMRQAEFQITAVGIDANQAAAAAELAEGLLDGKTVVSAPGARPRRITRTEDNLPVSEDPKWTRPAGGSLWLSVARYTAGTRRPAPTT